MNLSSIFAVLSLLSLDNNLKLVCQSMCTNEILSSVHYLLYINFNNYSNLHFVKVRLSIIGIADCIILFYSFCSSNVEHMVYPAVLLQGLKICLQTLEETSLLRVQGILDYTECIPMTIILRRGIIEWVYHTQWWTSYCVLQYTNMVCV